LMGHANAWARNHDITIAREVFAKIGVLPRHGREAGRIDDDRKMPRRQRCVAHSPHWHGKRRLRTGLKPLVNSSGMLWLSEAGLRRLQSDVASYGYRTGSTFLGWIPDQRLQRPRSLTTVGLAQFIDQGLKYARVVVLFHHFQPNCMRALLRLQGKHWRTLPRYRGRSSNNLKANRTENNNQGTTNSGFQHWHWAHNQ